MENLAAAVAVAVAVAAEAVVGAAGVGVCGRFVVEEGEKVESVEVGSGATLARSRRS